MLCRYLNLLLAILWLLALSTDRCFQLAADEATDFHAAVSQQVADVPMPKGISGALWQMHIPTGNPVTPARIELGRLLFFDKRLSLDGTISCATCHDPATAFADRNSLALGIRDESGSRNVPALLNAMFNKLQFWDGRARTLEEQVKHPLLNASEMGMRTEDAVVARVRAIPEYQREFRQVFAGEITMERIAQAIAAFERTLLSGDSPFDRFIAGDHNTISEPQKRGWGLFRGKAGCIACHEFQPSVPFFTDLKFHNTGIAARVRNLDLLIQEVKKIAALDMENLWDAKERRSLKAFAELGRFLVTDQRGDIGAFKTPTLRDVELTSPYMHDGSIKTLLDVIRFYNQGGQANPYLDKKIQPLNLSDEEMNDLVEFLRSLTSHNILRQVQQSQPQNRKPVALPNESSH